MSLVSLLLCALLFGGTISVSSGQDSPSAPAPASPLSSPPPPPPPPPPSTASGVNSTQVTEQTNEPVELPSGPVSISSSDPAAVADQIASEQSPTNAPPIPQQVGEVSAANHETDNRSEKDEHQPVVPQPEQQEQSRQQAQEQEPQQESEREQPAQKQQPEQIQQTEQKQLEQMLEPDQTGQSEKPEQSELRKQLHSQQQQTNEEVENTKPDVESIQEGRQPAIINNTISHVDTNEIVESNGILELVNNTSVDAMNGDEYNYNIENSCNLTSIVPDEIIQMAVRRILNTTVSKKCSTFLNLKLKPMTNQRIKGYVMEVSSMPVDLVVLTGALSTQITCSNVEYLEEGKKIKLNMIFSQDLGDKKLESKWRSYAEIQHDDIPVRLFGGSVSRRNLPKTSSKCQKFKLEMGNFELDLLSFKTKSMFEITLVKLDDRSWSSKDNIGGGKISLKSIQVEELYLDDRINLDSIGREKLNMASPTVQILHEQNNHFRRNNWLLDLYGNWLKHEYKQQLTKLLTDITFLERFNSCFGY